MEKTLCLKQWFWASLLDQSQFKENRNFFFQFRIEHLLTMRYHGICIGLWREQETLSVLLTSQSHTLIFWADYCKTSLGITLIRNNIFFYSAVSRINSIDRMVWIVACVHRTLVPFSLQCDSIKRMLLLFFLLGVVFDYLERCKKCVKVVN